MLSQSTATKRTSSLAPQRENSLRHFPSLLTSSARCSVSCTLTPPKGGVETGKKQVKNAGRTAWLLADDSRRTGSEFLARRRSSPPTEQRSSNAEHVSESWSAGLDEWACVVRSRRVVATRGLERTARPRWAFVRRLFRTEQMGAGCVITGAPSERVLFRGGRGGEKVPLMSGKQLLGDQRAAIGCRLKVWLQTKTTRR